VRFTMTREKMCRKASYLRENFFLDPKWDVGVKETLLYAPRNQAEIELILKIVTISYWYASDAYKVTMPNNPLEGRVFDEKEQEAVLEVLKSGLMSRYTNWEGKVSQFEKKVSKHLGVNHALMVSTGSAAMIAGLMGLGIGPGDEVIVSAYTWISTAASVIAVGAVPVIAEIDDSLGMDPVAVESKITPLTKCLFLTHMAGVPNRIDALLAVAKKHKLFVVEDCCQCVGGKVRST
jgi:dTDP-4-amino-4,6-dideoxygalactose transaminase